MQREAGLNAKGYSERDEKRILDALGRGLLKEFPNPDRAGCPGSDILKRISSHEMPLTDAEKWLDHLTSCSPCYADFKRLQEAQDSDQRRRWLAFAASILLAVGVVGWALGHKRNENLKAETAVLDLRDRSASRGTEANSAEPPLEIRRGFSRLEIYLPFGSAEGEYEVRISAPTGESVLTFAETGEQRQGVIFVRVPDMSSSLRPGKYLLQIRKPSSEWSSYPIVVR